MSFRNRLNEYQLSIKVNVIDLSFPELAGFTSKIRNQYFKSIEILFTTVFMLHFYPYTHGEASDQCWSCDRLHDRQRSDFFYTRSSREAPRLAWRESSVSLGDADRSCGFRWQQQISTFLFTCNSVRSVIQSFKISKCISIIRWKKEQGSVKEAALFSFFCISVWFVRVVLSCI